MLHPPTSIDPAAFASVAQCKGKAVQATSVVKYWGGDPQPWRDGHDQPITDPAVIDEETVRKAEAETEDDAAGECAGSLRGRGVKIDFLLTLTFELDLWEWTTAEVRAALV